MANAREDWINLQRVKYFDLLEYISNIKLNDNVLFHLEDLAENFTKYIESLAKYCNNDESLIIYYWLDQGLEELRNSTEIENHSIKNIDVINSKLFFDKLSISHERIKQIQKFVCEHSDINTSSVGDYRKTEASVGAYINGEYQPYWYGAEVEDIKPFMDSFIKFYKTNSISSLYSNPFIKAALAHLLLVRIHPFGDGNGRTARIIQNISFTSGINKLYGIDLKLSPVNISHNIKLNVISYANYINRIRFDLEHKEDNNYWINRFLDFILNMYDEQLYYQTNRLSSLETRTSLTDEEYHNKQSASVRKLIQNTYYK